MRTVFTERDRRLLGQHKFNKAIAEPYHVTPRR